ncbi:hypothetical protein [Ramlibacter sp. WS9]|uniref:hypothetical protein n=1 Tax=Ramlibacter sp. WS9 TaxID=1882741 RepID=UPI00130520C6|nr:hypothetical protein [Ramlibacter sp. WS9]
MHTDVTPNAQQQLDSLTALYAPAYRPDYESFRRGSSEPRFIQVAMTSTNSSDQNRRISELQDFAKAAASTCGFSREIMSDTARAQLLRTMTDVGVEATKLPSSEAQKELLRRVAHSVAQLGGAEK